MLYTGPIDFFKLVGTDTTVASAEFKSSIAIIDTSHKKASNNLGKVAFDETCVHCLNLSRPHQMVKLIHVGGQKLTTMTSLRLTQLTRSTVAVTELAF